MASTKPMGKRKQPAKKDPTIVISPEFTGVILPDGEVIDDTAYFRAKHREEPVRAELARYERIQELKKQLAAATSRHAKDEAGAREIGLIQHWLEDVMIGVFASMLENATKGKIDD